MGLERLVAAVIVIGLIVWGASILATPDEPLPTADAKGGLGEEPTASAAPPREDREEDDGDEDDEPDEAPRKGKKHGRGDD